FTSVIPYNSTNDLDSILDTARDQDGLNFAVQPADEQSTWTTMLFTFIPLLIILFLFLFLMNQAQGGGGGGGKMMNFGKSKAKLYDQSEKKVHFDDVAGAGEEKQELIEVVDFLKGHRRFARIG